MLRQRNAGLATTGNQRRQSTVLTPTRKRMIEAFKLSWIRNHPTESRAGHEITMRTNGWHRLLFDHLSAQDSNITLADVKRWIKKHKWITVPGAPPKGLPNLVVNEVAPEEMYNAAISSVATSTTMESEESVKLPFYPGRRQEYHRQLPLLQDYTPVTPPTPYSDNDDNDDDEDDSSRGLLSRPLQHEVEASNINDENQQENAMDNHENDLDLPSYESEDEAAMDLRTDKLPHTLRTMKRTMLERYLASMDDNRDESSPANNNYSNFDDNNEDNTLEGDLNKEEREESISPTVIVPRSRQIDPIPGPSTSTSTTSGPPSNENTSERYFQPESTPPNANPIADTVPTPCHNLPQIPNGSFNQWNPFAGPAPNDFNAQPEPPHIQNSYQGKQHAVSYIFTYIAVHFFILFVTVSIHHTLKLAPGTFNEGSGNQLPPGGPPPFNHSFAPFTLGMHTMPAPRRPRQHPLLNQVLRHQFLKNRATGMEWNSCNNPYPLDGNHSMLLSQPPMGPMSQTVPPAPTPRAGPAGQPQQHTMTSGTSQQSPAPNLMAIMKNVNLKDAQFTNPLMTPAERTARMNLIVESLSTVCQQVPNLRSALPHLTSFMVPVNREMRKQMFPMRYEAARKTAMEEMKRETREDICVDSDSDN
ncbi:unnamed protein product [Orchesella dallaii]|uniref:Uncharacterized protein n=1 Tax=Orchesella dallaii TaxID=48710 RepID=A0ABP1PVC0_9HEXA